MYTVSEALNLGLERSRARICARHLRNQEKAVEVITDYLKTHKPNLQSWSELTIDDIRDYVAHLEAKNLTPNTIRAYTNPLRLAHRACRTSLSVDYLKIRDIIPVRGPVTKRFLSLEQAMRIVNRSNWQKHRAGWFCLSMGILAGLRITEAMSICNDTYDSKRQVILINHGKNTESERIIPLTPAAVEVVERHLTTPYQTGRHKPGKPYKNVSTASHEGRWVLEEMADTYRDKSFTMVTPAEAGRKTFMNIAEEHEVDPRYIRAYCGHAAYRWDTMSRHYLGLKAKSTDMPHVQEKALRMLRENIVEPLSKLF